MCVSLRDKKVRLKASSWVQRPTETNKESWKNNLNDSTDEILKRKILLVCMEIPFISKG